MASVVVVAALGAAVLVQRGQHWLAGNRPYHGPVTVPAWALADGRLEHVEYRLRDGVDVRGWYVPSRTGAALVFAHGSPGTRLDVAGEAQAMVAAGYGALMLDMPGHGESGGEADWGDDAREALSSGVDLLTRRADVDLNRIGGFGFSMGSCIMAQVAARDRRFAAVVLTGVFTTSVDQIRYQFRGWGPLSQWPAVWGARYLDIDVDRLRPIDVAARLAPTPALFVAGAADTIVSPAMTRAVFEAAGDPKEFLLVPGADHGQYASVAAGPEYLARVRAFYDAHLVGRH